MAFNRGCNLECVADQHGGDEVIEFVGPVKIILVDQPKSAYIKRVLGAAIITLAQMLMGATAIIVLYYSLSYKSSSWLPALHVFLSTVGFQLCMPAAILSVNKLNGAVTHMKIPDRIIEHLFLQICAILCVTGGFFASFFSDYFDITVHSVLGFVAISLAVVNVLFGLLTHYEIGNHECMVVTHKIFGCLSFILSSACFITGLMSKTFRKWIPIQEMSTFSIIFCCVYSFVVLYKPLRHLEIF